MKCTPVIPVVECHSPAMSLFFFSSSTADIHLVANLSQMSKIKMMRRAFGSSFADLSAFSAEQGSRPGKEIALSDTKPFGRNAADL